MRMHVEKNGMTVTTELGVVEGESRWISTIAKNGVILGRKVYRQSNQAILGHARLAATYLDELSSENA